MSKDASDGTEDGRFEFAAMQGGTLTGLMELGYDGNGNGINLFAGGVSGSGLSQICYPDVANAYFAFGSDITYASGGHTWRPAGFSTDGNPDPNDSGGSQSLSMQAQSDISIRAGYGGKDAGNASADISFYTASGGVQYTSTERMRIKGDGNVGIGTSAPSYTLDVYTADASGNPTINISDGVTYLRSYISDAAYVQSDDPLYLWSRGSYAMLRSENASTTIQANSDVIFKAGDSEVVRMLANGNVGIGTSAPSNTLEVAGVIRGTNYIWQKQDGTPGVLFGAGGDADIYYDGTNMIFNAARVGSGKESHITTVHASGASFQKDLGESLYIRAIHGGFDQNAVLVAAPNIQYVAPAGPSAAGSSVIPTELPLAEAGMEGLEITVMQTWAADPTAALQVQVSTGSPDVIYEGGSNSASANVSVAAYRGANKTFIITAAGVWVVKG